MPDDANLATMKATTREPEIVTRNGKPVSVIIPIKDYEELLERAEDAEDVEIESDDWKRIWRDSHSSMG